MMGAVALVTAVYLLMAAGLVLSVPHWALAGSPGNFAALAGFATAFDYKGLGWAKYVVAAGGPEPMEVAMRGDVLCLQCRSPAVPYNA